ncbi:MAG: bifunctional methylenetetrahydrofolate dehydrogenase/methenyltetrahydrofolate cyclohydrolase FolD [Syntrophorhabdus sp.]|jgi:methylenetetrahydrofolate dehydrogenase (NADP+)/methenyltetrahydrofolate cyclohydrolase|nr:bifunctional methylenetetrahydrofolate dehydrogenase/methenyltetrahydrofolate cyclohydrolase FolD [Syntrophorhabdus sp.]
MTARILSGTDAAKQVRERIARDVVALRERTGVTPGLVTILVGDNPASVSYVTGKQRTARELGFYSVQDDQPEGVSEEELLDLIQKYNSDPSIHGILVQLPLPKHINETRVLYAIDPDKDVDGLHPMNLGRLMIGEARFYPCTPFGIRELLGMAGVETKGAEVVVVGRSNLVGKPISMMLVQKEVNANATVTMCHTSTRDLGWHTRRADILIVAAGKAKAITADMVKDGAVVIDVGVNRIGMTAEGKAKLCGDVDFETVKEKASVITPVPGGVGPMTITMLMQNTLKAAEMAAEGK